MPFEKTSLLQFLEEVDKELEKPIYLIAVGGTAMTLLNLKTSTIDIDFDLSSADANRLNNALKKIPHGFKVDIFTDGLIFSQQLPEDYVKKCISMKTSFKRIKLLALRPLDIIVTKIGRLNERDIQDIKACIKKFKLSKKQVESRAKEVHYVGHEDNYKMNLQFVLKRLFKEG